MKTPVNYVKSLQRHELTPEMIGACAYSCNKRAKNARDKQAYYRNRRWMRCYDKFENEDHYREKKEYYYELKDKMIHLFEPECIHYVKESGEYFLLYRIGEYTFHNPIYKGEIETKYKHLKLYTLEKLVTSGRNINDLVSCQFIKKVIDLIDSGDYTIVK